MCDCVAPANSSPDEINPESSPGRVLIECDEADVARP